MFNMNPISEQIKLFNDSHKQYENSLLNQHQDNRLYNIYEFKDNVICTDDIINYKNIIINYKYHREDCPIISTSWKLIRIISTIGPEFNSNATYHDNASNNNTLNDIQKMNICLNKFESYLSHISELCFNIRHIILDLKYYSDGECGYTL